MELYLIRHGQSTHNAMIDHLDQECDPPLTELGKRQAERVARALAKEANPGQGQPAGSPITRLYCSPMWRALQTAQPIGQALGLRPEVWVELHEQGGMYLDYGESGGIVGQPGKTRQEILATFPNYVISEGVTEQGWWQHGFEDIPACHKRAAKVAEVLRQWAASTERIAIISHGTFNDALLKALLKQLPGHHFFYYHHNAAISRIDFHRDDHLNLHYLNRVTHLPPELLSS